MIDGEDAWRCHHVSDTKGGHERPAEPGRHDEFRSRLAEPFGGASGASAPNAGNMNRDVCEFADRASKRRGLAFEREQNGNHVSCHISILKLSPSREFIPSAAATSYPECIIQCSHRGSLP